MFKMTKENELVQFSLKKKSLAQSYTNTKNLRNYYDRSRNSTDTLDLSTFTSGDQIDKYFRAPGSNTDDCITLSNTLYDVNRIYSDIINYYCNMYYIRYKVVPRLVKNSKRKNKKEYLEIYHEMLEYVEGVSLESTIPNVLLQLFKNGRVFIYVDKHTSSKTVQTLILPNKYCKPTFMTQFGSQMYEFDFTWFTSLGLKSNEILELIEKAFPAEFLDKYNLYLADKNKNRWQELNGKFATCISMNEEGFPSLLSILYDIIDNKTYKLNELDKNTNQLQKLVAQEIDMEATGLDMEEVQALHDSMADIICANTGVTLVTTVGKIAVHQLQENSNVQNDTLDISHKNIFDNAGLNSQLFTGDSDFALKVSLRRDLQFVWSFIQKLELFYNIALNNMRNFGDYQLSLSISNVSPYNEDDLLENLHQSATLGVGVIDYIVASGTKQIDIEPSIELEEHLDLTNRLKPLQSSHTQSSTGNEEPKKSAENGKDEEDDKSSAPKEDESSSESLENEEGSKIKEKEEE